MKKYFKLVLLILILNIIPVSASTGVGVCYGKKVDKQGRCKINLPTVTTVDLFTGDSNMKYSSDSTGRGRLRWMNIESSKYAKSKYPVAIEVGPYHRYYIKNNKGEIEDLHCLDANLYFENVFTHAQPMVVNQTKETNFDTAITKLYQIYVEEMNKKYKGDLQKGQRRYGQFIYSASRAVSINYGNHKSNYSHSTLKLINKSKESTTNLLSKFINEHEKYAYLQKELARDRINDGGRFSLTNITNSDYQHMYRWYKHAVSSSKAKTFDVKVEQDNDDKKNVKTIYDKDKFIKEVPLTLSGLNNFRTGGFIYDKLKPSVQIKGISCSNNKVECKLVAKRNTNLLDQVSKDKYKFSVEITGNRSNFMDKSERTNINFSLEKSHPQDPDALAMLLPLGETGAYYQRMMWHKPESTFSASVPINISIPALCETGKEGGKTVYKYAGEIVELNDYLGKGCCNIDEDDLKDAGNYNTIKQYFNKCTTGDQVFLENDCNNVNGGKESLSWVKHQDIKQILKVADNYDNDYIKSNKNSAAKRKLSSDYAKLDRYIDDEYLLSSSGGRPLSGGNTYCHMFVSEYIEVKYPGTFTTVSGRYFRLREDPKLTSKADVAFRFAEKRWNTDRNLATNTAEITQLMKYKNECDVKNNLRSNWNYALNPKLTFYYQTSSHDSHKNETTKIIHEEVMELKPNSRNKCNFASVSKTGSSEIRSANCNYDGHYEPSYKYILPVSGRVVTEETDVELENTLEVGSVAFINVTATKGVYSTWFKLENVGHKYGDNEVIPKTQILVDDYIDNNERRFKNYPNNNEINDNPEINTDNSYLHVCEYNNDQVIITPPPECTKNVPCSDMPQYYFRTISNKNVTPNVKSNNDIKTNWTTEKGASAKAEIEEKGDNSFSPKHLEYSFTISPSDLHELKTTDDALKLGTELSNCVGGKECESKFLNMLADKSAINGNDTAHGILKETRKNKWKYYIDGKWEVGSISTIGWFGEKGYPTAEDKLKNTFTYWP